MKHNAEVGLFTKPSNLNWGYWRYVIRFAAYASITVHISLHLNPTIKAMSEMGLSVGFNVEFDSETVWFVRVADFQKIPPVCFLRQSDQSP